MLKDNSIELVMPLMRPESGQDVIDALCNQSRPINQLRIVDNCGNFRLSALKKQSYPFGIRIEHPRTNIGVNAVWNKMWQSKHSIVGLIADDLTLERRLIELLARSITDYPEAGGITAEVFRDKEIDYSKRTHMTKAKVKAKGHLGVTLFSKKVLNLIPTIPKNLFVYYGDNWIGYWLKRINRPLYEVSAGIAHYGKTDIKSIPGHLESINKDKILWQQWKAGQIKLNGHSYE